MAMLWDELGRCSRTCLFSFSISGQPLEKTDGDSRIVGRMCLKFPAQFLNIVPRNSLHPMRAYIHVYVCVYKGMHTHIIHNETHTHA